MKGTFCLWLAALILACGASIAAPAQNQPLGDYARSVRKDKKPPAAKQFDNDNIPRDDKLSVVGPSNPTPAGQESTPPTGATDQGTPGTEKKAAVEPGQSQGEREKAYDQWKDKISAQKSAVDLVSRELDVLQREYRLRAAAMYGDVGNRLRNSAEWDKEDQDYKQKIADKQKEVDAAKQSLDDLQEEARKAGVPSSVRE